MKRVVNILMIGMAASLAAVAQEQSESVEGVMRELGSYSGPKTTAPAPVSAPAAVEPAAVQVAPAPAEEIVISAPAAAPEQPIDELIDESRDLYVGGEFERAQAGFEAVVKRDPENIVARLYLRKLLERDHRMAEISGMQTIEEAWDTGLVLRSYTLSDAAAEKMELGAASGPMNIENKFPEVSFAEGSSAVYQPKLGKLFVRNTRENLAVIEEILDAMDVAKLSADVEQIEIEAKFVEVSEGTLEELGFEWRSKAGNNIDLGNDVIIPGGQYLFDDALRGGPSGPAMPFTQLSTLGAGATGAAGSWSAFRFEDTFSSSADTITLEHRGSNPIDLVISALDQSSGADVLSAPRVVTRDGEEAVIRVGELHHYPEVYEVSASGGNIVHVTYEDWEERLLGVELTVQPQVNGDQIEMALNPKITELLEWQTYDVAPADSSYTWYQYRIGEFMDHDDIQAKLPVFRVREIETEVTIADGATIGMGGLINEKIESFEDKVPVLGSLPLVGRLFRNEGERNVKRNLLMFVTARKVEPTGRINTARSFE